MHDLDAGEFAHHFFGAPQGDAAIHLRQDHDEFLAAHPAGDVLVARTIAQQSRERDQHRIAGAVAVAVVEGLEMVEVEGHHRQRLLAPAAARHLAPERFGQVTAIEQAGERIAYRQVAQALPQAQVGQRLRELFARGDRDRELRERADARRTEIDPAQRFALGGQRDAGGADRFVEFGVDDMRADAAGTVEMTHVQAFALHCPAVVGAGQGFRLGGVDAPEVTGFGQAFAFQQRINAAGTAG